MRITERKLRSIIRESLDDDYDRFIESIVPTKMRMLVSMFDAGINQVKKSPVYERVREANEERRSYDYDDPVEPGHLQALDEIISDGFNEITYDDASMNIARTFV